MPLFDFKCDECGHIWEDTEVTFKEFGTRGPTECPKCQSKKFHKLPPTGGSFVLKGSGWYKTDNQRKK